MLQLAYIQIHAPIVIMTLMVILGVHSGMMLENLEKDGISSLIPIKMVPTGQILRLMVIRFDNTQRVMTQHFLIRSLGSKDKFHIILLDFLLASDECL